MSKIIEKWVVSNYAPETNMGWIDTSCEKPVNKVFVNGKWVIEERAMVLESFTIPTLLWTNLTDKEPYTRKTTIAVSSPISEGTIVELFNDNAVLFANYGFAIGEINGLNVVIYAITNPSTNVTLTLNIID